jgi:ABC-type dipeptide/oligopeptide/nickel transport system ATPase component
MAYFRFKTDDFDLDLNLLSKVCVVSGYSGAGKSLFVRAVQDELDMPSGAMISNMTIHVVKNKEDLEMVESYDSNDIVIAEEPYASKIYNLDNMRCYAILISRKRNLNKDSKDKQVLLMMR